MKSRHAVSRRRFLGTSLAVAGFPTIIPGSALGLNGAVAPSERVVLGSIGVGDRGRAILEGALQCKEAQVVGVCDVKANCREAATALINDFYGNQDCFAVKDHAELLAKPDIDGVIVASCDHWHVLHALAATRLGKGVYVEKPMGCTVAEDQALRAAVRKHGTVFQFGTQQRSDGKFHDACSLVRMGAIGELHTVYVWAPPSVAGAPTQEAPVPETLDYERWVGPAPFKPYTLERDSNKWWWHISDYALGFIAGWGIHPADIAYWGAGDAVRTPFTIEGVGRYPVGEVCDTATDWKATCTYDSGLVIEFRATPAPRDWVDRFQARPDHGTAFVGSEGWIQVNRSGMTCFPESVAKKDIKDSPLFKSRHHMRDYVQAIRDKRQTVAPIDEAVQSDLFCQVADIALRVGKPLRWDPAAERFANSDEANARLSRPMRAPWSLEG
ncbi:MAG TPA: Gfo/Idh/MocA family oxidoreductase [Candidatus Hydrogenedentes bacterium]|nr:Gfo/Idh/MocA family oxidoreductase [Candidatus Hydrogenedentota bacterium]